MPNAGHDDHVKQTAVAARDAGARRHVPDLPELDEVIGGTGRHRFAVYYLYGALLTGVTGTDDLAPAPWPPELSGPSSVLPLRQDLDTLRARAEGGLTDLRTGRRGGI